jgi:DNA-binding protein HU-beta
VRQKFQRGFVESNWKRRHAANPSAEATKHLRSGRKDALLSTQGAPLMRTAAQNTVTIKHLAAALAEQHEMAKKQSQEILNDAIDLVTKHLKKGDRIRIAGLGILQVRKRPARMGRNPATGEPIKIKASKKVAFRAAKDLKEAV